MMNAIGTKSFSKREALKFGWETMKANFWFFAGLLAVVLLVSWVPGAIAEDLKERERGLAALFDFISWVLGLVVSLGLIRIALNFCDGASSRVADIFSQYRLFFKYFLASILYGLAVFGGFLLFVIPGIIWGIRFRFYGYFIVDKGLGPIEALKRSYGMVMGVTLEVLLFGLLLFGINVLGVLALGVGLFATIPTTMIAWASVYRTLLTQLETDETHLPPSQIPPTNAE